MPLSRRHFLVSALAVSLAGCGFHLRGAYVLPFETMYLEMPQNNPFTALIVRQLRAGSNVKLVDEIKDAQAILRIISDSSGRKVSAYNSKGDAREYELSRTIVFKVTAPDGFEYLEPTEISVSRMMMYDESRYSSRDDEEKVFKKEMQVDISSQMIRRIEKAKKREK